MLFWRKHLSKLAADSRRHCIVDRFVTMYTPTSHNSDNSSCNCRRCCGRDEWAQDHDEESRISECVNCAHHYHENYMLRLQVSAAADRTDRLKREASEAEGRGAERLMEEVEQHLKRIQELELENMELRKWCVERCPRHRHWLASMPELLSWTLAWVSGTESRNRLAWSPFLPILRLLCPDLTERIGSYFRQQ